MKGLNGKLAFWISSIILLLLLLHWAPTAPINVDELLHNKQAKYVVDWYYSFGADETCLENRTDNLRYYGQSVDNVAAFVNKAFSFTDEYLTRHYIGAIVGWLLLIVSGLFSYYLSGSFWVGILAMVLLFLSPRPFGQVFGNLKDIPFALAYTWATWGTIRFIKELPLPSYHTALNLALSIAFANSVRIGGSLFFFILGSFTIVWLVLNRKDYSYPTLLQRKLRTYLFITAVIILLGYFGGLLLWPYGLQNPLSHPYESLTLMQHYSISIRQIFEGNYFWSTHLPWYYLLKWLAISIPELVWFLVLLSSVMLFRGILKKERDEKISVFILLFCILFPVLYVIIIDANLYSGWRQLYFFYPVLVVFVSVGTFEFWKSYRNKIVRTVFVSLVLVLGFFPLKHLLKTFPNHYIYFNELSKLQKDAWSEYEYDYYFQGMKEASDWFFSTVTVPEGSVIASNFDLTPYFPKNLHLKYKYLHFYEYQTKQWDYAIFSNNYVHPYQLKNDTWLPDGLQKIFYFDKNPYVVVLNWEGDNVLTGLSAFKKGLYNKAAQHFEMALEKNGTNVNTMVYLARCYLIESKFDNLELIFQKAMEINPYSEQMLYLKAKMYFQQTKYDQALRSVESLLEMNPKFEQAFPLLASCYEKTGQADKALNIRKQIK
ncbi:MAG: CDC27 family protein [Prolixibacteraceae bacterium]